MRNAHSGWRAEFGPVGAQCAGVERQQTDPQLCGLAAGCQLGAPQAVLELQVDRSQILPQLVADRGEPHAPIGSFEQQRANLPLLLLNRLSDARRRHPKSLGGAPEMQLLGQRQEDLDIS